MARNLVRELRRRDSRQYALAAQEAQRINSGALTEAQDVAMGVSDREAALQALASLSPADRELLTLIAWHGLAPKQAARRGAGGDNGDHGQNGVTARSRPQAEPTGCRRRH